jgi:uncharacterized membrane protein (DUF373 family)
MKLLSRITHEYEKVVVITLVALLMLVITLAVIDLAWLVIDDIITPPVLIFEVGELLEIFGAFLLILIGIELMETVKVYMETRTIRVEIVIEVALIAIARKIIILEGDDGVTRIGIAAVVIALALAIYFARRTRNVAARPADDADAPEVTAH